MIKDQRLPEFLLLNVGYWKHHADWNFQEVNSPFSRLYLVEEGEAKVRMNGEVYVFTPNHLYLVPAFTVHTNICEGDFSLYYMHLFERQDEKVDFNFFEQWHLPVEVEATEYDRFLVQRLMQINPERGLVECEPSYYDNHQTLIQTLVETKQSTMPAKMETEGILMQLLSRFLQHATPHIYHLDNRIMQILAYIRKNIDKVILTNDLAAQCFLSEDHFIRLFRKEMRCTPLDYVHQKKIEKAQVLIVMGNESMKDIACKLGFSNQSYFNRLFKKETDMTPVQYKKKYQFV